MINRAEKEGHKQIPAPHLSNITALTAQYTITAVRCLKQEKIDEN